MIVCGAVPKYFYRHWNIFHYFYVGKQQMMIHELIKYEQNIFNDADQFGVLEKYFVVRMCGPECE